LLRIDHTDDSGKRILVFAAEDSAYLIRNKTSFFLDGTFESCPRQFAQLHSLHVDLGSTAHESYIHPVLFALLPDKKETTYHCLLTLQKSWCVFWLPKIIKVDFEAAVISEINKVFLDPVITGCNFHFKLCLWKQVQNIGLRVEY
jgi:hypothetical protein